MEDALLVLLGIAATLIVGLLGFVGVLVRRNNRNSAASHNPGAETIELLCQQQLETLRGVERKLDDVLLALMEMKSIMQFCPQIVQRRTGGG